MEAPRKSKATQIAHLKKEKPPAVRSKGLKRVVGSDGFGLELNEGGDKLDSEFEKF